MSSMGIWFFNFQWYVQIIVTNAKSFGLLKIMVEEYKDETLEGRSMV